MRKLILAAVLLFAAAPVAHADILTFFEAYDVTSTGYTYCAWSGTKNGAGFIKTSGSSNTVTAVDATNTAPFKDLAAGDEISVFIGVPPAVTETVLYVATHSSNTSVVVAGSAVNLANGGLGWPFRYRNRSCGTTSADGWVDVSQYRDKTLQLIVTTINAASITFTVEGRISGRNSTASTIYTSAAVTTASALAPIPIPENVSAIRVGAKEATDAGAQSISAYLKADSGYLR